MAVLEGEGMKYGAQVIRTDKDWWKQERKPASRQQPVIIGKLKPLSKKYYSPKEIASIYNVGVWLIYGLIRSGKLEAEVIGKQKRISQEALDAYRLQNRAG